MKPQTKASLAGALLAIVLGLVAFLMVAEALGVLTK